MTTADNPALCSRSISERRAAVDAMEPGDARDLAQFHFDVLVFIRRCQELLELSDDCNKIQAKKGGANPRRPYLNWECCDGHRELKVVRGGLERRAAELRVKFTYDVLQPVTD